MIEIENDNEEPTDKTEPEAVGGLPGNKGERVLLKNIKFSITNLDLSGELNTTKHNGFTGE